MYAKSAISDKTKTAVIKNERRRIMSRCTEEEDKVTEMSELEHRLRKMDYNERFIHNTRGVTTNEEERVSSDEVFYFKFPFLGDKVNWKIRRFFLKEGLNVRLAQKGTTLRQALNNKTNPNNLKENCKAKRCAMKNNHCNKAGVVYTN